jgi:hypothetical protein
MQAMGISELGSDQRRSLALRVGALVARASAVAHHPCRRRAQVSPRAYEPHSMDAGRMLDAARTFDVPLIQGIPDLGGVLGQHGIVGNH